MKQQRFILSHDTARQRAIAAVTSAPDGMEVLIRKYKSKRTLSQNALHWKRLDIIRMHIADSTGQIFSAEELHDFFKRRFLPVRLVEIDGDVEKVAQTTTDKDTKQMAEFMDAIDRYCIERLGLYLPVPGMEDVA
jgi:hypothetical protein